MIGLWILAALLSAGVAVLVLRGAAKASGSRPDEPAERSVYRRQMAELDDLVDRGLLAPAEAEAARAEAGRRLLSTAEVAPPLEENRSGRRLVLILAAAAPLATLALYAVFGSPGLPDAPYAQRLEQWRAQPPESLAPAEMAALLTQIAREQPADATPLIYLAQAQAASGQQARVLITLREAVRRQPARADAWIMLGQAEVAQAEGRVTDEARQAFEQAARLNPAAPEPPYFLARGRIAAGDVAGGLQAWRALLERLPPEAPQRQALAAEIAQVASTGTLPAARSQPAEPAGDDQRAFIQAMVDRLAQRLTSAPDDPGGWARLVRSYGILGQADRRQAAIDEARRRFASRPDVVRAIEAGDEQAARRAGG